MMPTWIILGLRGSGKNLLLTLVVLNSALDTHSNTKFKSKKYKPLTLFSLFNLPNDCNVIIDEAYSWIESRASQQYVNKYLSYINFQLRKTNRDIFITAQDEMSIDVRFRRIWDYCITCERKNNGNLDKDKWDFQYRLYINANKFVSPPMILSYERAKLYFKYFDTNEIIDMPAKSRIEYELLKNEPKQLLTKALRIANELSKSGYINSYTLDDISLGLLALDYDDSWTKIVYKILHKKININKILSGI
jgi:hypothetical protein